MIKKLGLALCAATIIMQPMQFASARSISLAPDLRWDYNQYNDASNRGRMTSNLAFAVPETDAVMFSASCAVGSSGNFSVVKIGASNQIQGMRDGDAINVSFSANGWQRTMRGNVIGTRAEFGISGVELIIDNDDQFWSVMRDASRMSYSVRGDALEMSLRGSGRQITPFLKDCRFYASQQNGGTNQPRPPKPQVPPVPPRAKADPRWATCDLPQNQRSLNSDTPVTITFRNNSGEYRSVEWMGFDGTPKNYASLNHGEEYTQQTFLTHPWMFTDGPGNCIEIFQPQLGVTVFEIGAKSPGFGSGQD